MMHLPTKINVFHPVYTYSDREWTEIELNLTESGPEVNRKRLNSPTWTEYNLKLSGSEPEVSRKGFQ